MNIRMIGIICMISLYGKFAYGQINKYDACNSTQEDINYVRELIYSGKLTLDSIFSHGSGLSCYFADAAYLNIKDGCNASFQHAQKIGCKLRLLQRSEFTAPTRTPGKPTPNASQQPSPQNRTASPPPQPKPTAIKGGNRNKCIKHSKAKEQYGYNFTNNCNETVYVEIVRETDGGLYHFILKPGETTRHFWGEGKSKFRACKGGDSTALDACGG